MMRERRRRSWQGFSKRRCRVEKGFVPRACFARPEAGCSIGKLSAAVSACAVAGCVEMEMVAVGGIGLRAEDRAEDAAGPTVHLAQHAVAPARQDREPAAVAQDKARDVDGMAPGMFRQARTRDIVAAPAGITARRLDPGEAAAMPADLRMGHTLDPGG